jgi:uncharacterized coiled-coil protein SlyX
MKITFEEYTISRAGKSAVFNLSKKVVRLNKKTSETYDGIKGLGSVSFERAIQLIIYDMLQNEKNVQELSEFLCNYTEKLDKMNKHLEQLTLHINNNDND